MSGSDGSDWFGGARPAEAAEPPPAAEPPRPAAEPQEPEVVSALAPATGPVPELVAALADAANAAPDESASTEPEPAAALEVVPEATREVTPEVTPEVAPEPTPESDSRVRLRALTGGLADLSDALAAIGVESVAVRGSSPASPASPESPAPAAASSAADFRVRCPDCGPQYVAVSDVRFVETGDGAEANRYLFTCPACGARVRRPAGRELAEILKSAGVATLALRRGPGQAL